MWGVGQQGWRTLSKGIERVNVDQNEYKSK